MDTNIDLREQTENLVKLQSIESGKIRINAILAKVDEKIGDLDRELAACRAIVEKKEEVLDNLRKKYRETESELNMNAPRIEKSQEKLRAVKNNKEYQSLLKEIDELKKQSSLLEDGMLESLEQIEQLETEVKESEIDFQSIEERIRQDKEEVGKETEAGRLELETLNAEWEKVSTTVAPDLFRTFEMIRKKVRGAAITPVINAVCQGCNMNIPPQLYNDLLRFDSLKHCPSCQRIIYPVVE